MNLPLLILCGLLLSSAAISVFVRSFRISTLSIWAAGLVLGFIFLMLGSEVLAIGQWVFSTLTAFSFLVYSLLFGDLLESEKPSKSQWRGWIMPFFGAICFALIIGVGLHDFEQWTFELSMETFSLRDFGKQLVSSQPLTLVAVGIHILLVTIGFGVVARADWIRKDAER